MSTSMRVLAVEDSPTQAAVLRSHLTAADFDVSMASDGAQALELLAEERFGIVVSDVMMPVVDGYELCRTVKDQHPGIPVVLLTSMSDPLDVVNALSAGADNFLRKPYEPEELVARIRNILYNKKLRRSGPHSGVELFFRGQRHTIDSDREQMLDLLVSTFEDLVSVNETLRTREDELARSNAEVRLRLAETELEQERLRSVLSALPQGLAVMDAEGRIVEVNDNIADLLDTAASSLVGTHVWDAVRFTDRSRVEVDGSRIEHAVLEGTSASLGTAFDLFLERDDGSRVPIMARTAPVRRRDGTFLGSIGVLQDIGDLFSHDAATGLPGHGILIERLRAASLAEGVPSTGLLVVAINRFDRMREALPPVGGEQIIAAVARRLRTALASERVSQRSPTASAAYLGSGELAVIATDIDSERDAIMIGEILADELAGSITVGGIDVDVDVSVGVGMCTHGTDPAELVASAATAAHRLSGDGRSVASTDPHMHARVVERLQRESELRRGLAAGEIVAHYQPQVRLRPGHPVGVEALVRWEHPHHGLLGAGEIIPLAIESGLISRLGWTMLEQACRQAHEWRQHLPGAEDLQLSVNVAVQQLADEAVVDRVAEVLAATGFEPTALTLEITETSVMGVSSTIGDRLRGIKALGVQIAIDDFGTGYSSLLQLRHLPIDVLKIDREFVSGMIDESADAAIVAGTISLAEALGLELVAEGVETLEQLVQLRVLGCGTAQGFYWAKPLAPAALEQWWREQPRFGTADEPSLVRGVKDANDDTIAYLIHELRSPLTAVTGYADLLARDIEAAPAPDMIAGIRRNAREIEARLASVNEARQAETGGIRLSPEPVELVDLVRTVVHDLEPQLLPHPVSVDAPAADVIVGVDRSRLLQALTNLLTNAAKFSPGDTPIEVSVRSDDDSIGIRVRDHGPGIPDHRRPELFRRFSRLGSRNKGMGVGLYLSRLIVVAHGGSLDYEPAPGGGAVFSIRLPRAVEARAEGDQR